MKKTEFASAERTDKASLLEINDLIRSTVLIEDLMNKLDQSVFILNNNRQTVYVNKSALKNYGIEDFKGIIGLRPGEIFDCRNADCVDGCGTSAFCKECGAVNAILRTQHEFADILDECLICSKDGTTYELAVSTRPFKFNNHDYTLFSISDISLKKRMAILEKIFFHDIINIAGGIHSMLKLVSDHQIGDMDKVNDMLVASSEQLINEINAHKTLKAAECGDLLVQTTMADSLMLINRASSMAENLKSAVGKVIYVDIDSDEFDIDTDETLLNRVLLNMLTNALEASSVGDRVTLAARLIDGAAEFMVHNVAVMPPDVKRNIFVKSFTTKKRGSGLGTHSIKMLTEKYLKGSVRFASEEGKGTDFVIRLPLQ